MRTLALLVTSLIVSCAPAAAPTQSVAPSTSAIVASAPPTASSAPGMPAMPPTAPIPQTHEADFVLHDFHFRDGSTLPELRIHYTTLGAAARDANGHTTNAVLILHGTGGSGQSLLRPQFAGMLFGPGQPLDASRYFIVLPDGIGHGKSSKPSDGMHARFPAYGYADMVAAQHELLVHGLGVDHARLVMGTSMGGMHTWMWAEQYPDFLDAAMPLASLPTAIAGRNRVWRKMAIRAIREDPEWMGGEYKTQPRAALQVIGDLLMIAGSAPASWQARAPTRDAADQFLDATFARVTEHVDANDFLYQISASADYDPWPALEQIKAPLVAINSADDFINPPELGIAERGIARVKNGRFVLIPVSAVTQGHGTHTWAVFWKDHLVDLLARSSR